MDQQNTALSSSPTNYGYQWQITFAATSSSAYVSCYYEHLYDVSIGISCSSAANMLLVYWPMEININTIACQSSSAATSNDQGSGAQITTTSDFSLTTSTDGGTGFECGYTFVYGWNG